METGNTNNNVNYQFKLMYVVGIVIAVAGHCSGEAFSLFHEVFPAYTFHMALFVFCSGYFYKQSSEEHIIKYIVKKVKILIVPLYMWNVVYAFVVIAFRLKGICLSGVPSWHNLLVEPILSGHQFIFNLGGWFVIPLFMVEIYNILVRKILFFVDSKHKEIIVSILHITAGILGTYLASKGYNVGWGLVWTRMLYFIAFFEFGQMYKVWYEKRDKLSNSVYFGIVLTAQLGMILLLKGNIRYEQAWCKFGGQIVAPFIVGILGIAFWLRITRELEPVLGRSKFMNLIANNTFSIMINQFLGFMLVKSMFAMLYLYTSHFQDFDVVAFKTNIWYYYFPRGLGQFRMVYIFVGVMLPIIIQRLIDYGKGKLFKRVDNNFKNDLLYIVGCLLVVLILGKLSIVATNRIL